jgi:hypothetical protein
MTTIFRMTSTRAAIYPEDEFYDKLSSPLIKVTDQTDATSVNSDISHQVSQHDINALAVNPTFSQIVGLALVVSLGFGWSYLFLVLSSQ